VEDYYSTFSGTWSGTGTTALAGDAEILTLSFGQYEESPTWNLGAGVAYIDIDTYDTGSGPAPTIDYKTGTTKANCEADSWNTYNGTSFTGTGWVKVKLNR
jgi:hypothetical protein